MVATAAKLLSKWKGKYHNILLTQETGQAGALSENTQKSELKIVNGKEKAGNLGEGQEGRQKSHSEAPEEVNHPTD